MVLSADKNPVPAATSGVCDAVVVVYRVHSVSA
jgi:hypothetical protein